MAYTYKYTRIVIIYAIALICGLAFFSSCSNSDNAVGQNDTPVRIGIAWRGDSTSISYTSALQSVREAGGIPVPLPLLKSPFMEYEGDELLAQYTDEHGVVLQEYADRVKTNPIAKATTSYIRRALHLEMELPIGQDYTELLYAILEDANKE